MKKNILFMFISCTLITNMTVGMDNNNQSKTIIVSEKESDKKEEKKGIEIDTVNNQLNDNSFPNPHLSVKVNCTVINKEVINNQSPQEKVIEFFAKGFAGCVNKGISVVNNGLNSLSKMSGNKNITIETETEMQSNVLKISQIKSLQDLVYDYSHHSITSNECSFTQKAIARLYALNKKTMRLFVLIHANNNSDVDRLNELNETIKRQEIYQEAFNKLIQTLCKNLNEEMLTKTKKIIEKKEEKNINNNNNKEDKEDEEKN